jgi:hypothetical protein
MSITESVLRGARSPRALRLTITPGNTDADLSTATAVTLDVRNDAGVSQTWDTTIDEAASRSLSCHHVFDAEGLEVATPGRLSIVATITTTAGQYDAGPFTLNVIDR